MNLLRFLKPGTFRRHLQPLTARSRPRNSQPRAAARPTTHLSLERLEERDVPSLTPVGAGAGYPWTTMVELQATFPDHQTYVGSGAMVDSYHVLTAGHVLYSSSDGGWATQVKAVPELNGSSQPYGSASATYERTYTTFINYNKAHPGQTAPGDYDIGLLTLNRTVGNQTGWMGYGYNNNNAAFSSGTVFNTAGYPATNGYNGQNLEYSGGGIAGLSSDGSAIQYWQSSITTYGGQSGSPVWEYFPSTNSRVIYGVHVGGTGQSNSLNFATRITQGIFNDLQNWRNADHAPSASVAVGGPGTGSLAHQAFALTGTAANAQEAVAPSPQAATGDRAPQGSREASPTTVPAQAAGSLAPAGTGNQVHAVLDSPQYVALPAVPQDPTGPNNALLARILLASAPGHGATAEQTEQQRVASLDQLLGSAPGANTLLTNALLAAELGRDAAAGQPGDYRTTALDQLLGSDSEATTTLRQGENLQGI
jgi:glutamyl endopeptidase